VYVALLDGEVVAGLLVFLFNGTAEYFTPAVHHDHRSEQPLALLLLEAMAAAAARGCRRWNWGGTWSSQDGVYRFKRKWGARDGRYRYYVQINDESLLDAAPDELRARFGDFYVVPFSALRSSGGS
jgi:lipid II:glycine glycyltransferase (peptidoglycan interpeptide bridge formation enzyme)